MTSPLLFFFFSEYFILSHPRTRQNHKKQRQSGAGRTSGHRSQPHGKATRHVRALEGTSVVPDMGGDTEKGRKEHHVLQGKGSRG